jgi:hypothetical protein
MRAILLVLLILLSACAVRPAPDPQTFLWTVNGPPSQKPEIQLDFGSKKICIDPAKFFEVYTLQAINLETSQGSKQLSPVPVNGINFTN